MDNRWLVPGVILAIAIGAGLAWRDRLPESPVVSVVPAAPTVDAAAPSRVYKWRDDQGVVQFTSRPPVGRAFELIEGAPDITEVPTVVPDAGFDQSPSESDGP